MLYMMCAQCALHTLCVGGTLPYPISCPMIFVIVGSAQESTSSPQTSTTTTSETLGEQETLFFCILTSPTFLLCLCHTKRRCITVTIQIGFIKISVS